jgi:hypothetical protein
MPISSYNKGAQKAYKAMVSRYGSKKGKQIFYAKANKYKSGVKKGGMKARANATFATGGKLKVR